MTENIARIVDSLLLTSCVSLDDKVEGGQAKVLTAIDMGASINIKDPTSDQTALMASMIRGKHRSFVSSFLWMLKYLLVTIMGTHFPMVWVSWVDQIVLTVCSRFSC